MKTPVNILLTAIAYWLAWLCMLQPLYPSYLRTTTESHMDDCNDTKRHSFCNWRYSQTRCRQGILLSATFIALIVTFFINQISGETKDAITDHTADTNKKLKLSALLAGTFTIGVLATYYSGIDNSIYSNMGWERPV